MDDDPRSDPSARDRADQDRAAPVDLESLAGAVTGETTDTYAFSPTESYIGDRALVTDTIDADELLAFVRDRPDLLPTRVRRLFEMATD